MMNTGVFDRLHRLWETHELHMEIAVAAISAILLFSLATTPFVSYGPIGNADTISDTPLSSAPTLEETPVSPSSGSFVTVPEEESDRALLLQNITKTTSEIAALQRDSLSITALIQTECGGQTNACAQRLQGVLQVNADAYDAAQARLKALTASLGNLR
jgi:hypothetical protein